MKNRYKILFSGTIISLIFIITIPSSNYSINNESSEGNALNDLNTSQISLLTENFTATFNVSQTHNTISENAKICVDADDNVHVVWQDDIDGNKDILYRNFSYADKTWNEIINVSSTADESTNPDIVSTPSNDIFIVWSEADDIWYNIKYSNGTWNGALQVTTDGGASTIDKNPAIDSDNNGNLMVCYQAYDFSFEQLNVSYYTFSTKSWGTPKTAHYDSNNDEINPDIIWHNGVWHLVFEQKVGTTEYIYYKNNTVVDNWMTRPITDLTGGMTSGNAGSPQIAASSTHIYVTWHDELADTDYNVILKNKSIGSNWVSGEYMDITGNLHSSDGIKPFPKICVDNDDIVYLTYENDTVVYANVNLIKTGSNGYNYGLIASDTINSDKPAIAFNSYNEILVVWQEEKWYAGNPEILFRKLDTYDPHYNLPYLANHSNYKGNVFLNASFNMYDIAQLNYSFWVDEDENRIADDTGPWIPIHGWKKGDAVSLMNYTWNTNSTGNRLDIRKVIINASAVDENGLDETFLFSNVSIDNYRPQLIDLLDIYDESDHRYTTGDRRFTGNVTFDFNALDNNTGSGCEVILRCELGDIKLNSTNTEIKINGSDIPDGTYDFYLLAQDGARNTNTSVTFSNIVIDNTLPRPFFANLNASQEITHSYPITLSFPLDNDILNVSYYNYTNNPLVRTSIGNDTNGADGWSVPYHSIVNGFYGPMNITVNVTDQTRLTNSTTINVVIDNLIPTPIINDLSSLEEIGFETHVNITLNDDLQDNDTEVVKFWYKLEDEIIWEKFGELNFSDLTYDGINFRGSYIMDIVPLNATAGDYIQLRVEATDNQGLVGTASLTLKLRADTPEKVIISQVRTVYKVNITWTRVNLSISRYLIYRSYIFLDTDKINAMSAFDKFEFLGRYAGDKLCVGEVPVIDPDQEDFHFVDEVNGPNIYYYIVLVINEYGNPSESSNLLTIEIPLETPPRNTYDTISRYWSIFYIIFVIGVFIYVSMDVRGAKQKFFKSRVQVTMDTIIEDKFDGKDMGLTERLDKMEVDLGLESEKILRKHEVQEDFLSQSLEPETTTEILKSQAADTAQNRCPDCGWLLSSKARKCPRCGTKVGKERKDEKFQMLREKMLEEKIEDEEDEIYQPKIEKPEVDVGTIDDDLMRAKRAFSLEEPKPEEELPIGEKPPMKPAETDAAEEIDEVSVSNKCANCGWLLSSKALKCPRCGTEVGK